MTTDALDSTNINSLQLFQNPDFKVRVVMRYGKPWFVAKDVAECIEHSDTSAMCKLCRDRDKVVVRAKDLTSDDLSDVKNREYILISESGLYRILGKCSLPKCEPFESWVFDDVLPSIREKGEYKVPQKESTVPALPTTYIEALEALLESEKAKEAAKKALEAEQEAHEQDNRDYSEGLSILESKKAEIGSRREAKAMATASAKSRECARLAEENDELKDAVGRGANWRTVSMMKAEWVKEFGHTPVWQKLKQFSQDVCIDPVKDVEERVILKDGSEKVTIVNRYHREAWARYRKYEENLRVTDTEIFGV